ncbi:hypothetical protein NLA06_07995 [Desulfomicrobium sp. ZS1]|uniref:hypothetical protein n=1 Tax=Desulfomicrobium sp. ZS1 TaxID=2952228 RepID=UPI0020B41D7C|nr:hypothetical protein [Desulfomicrobium sp. ZS1]UTF51815.1 hypothetical protein NLA06_07995 [Desulfomicrobium sp. ZS1]
MTTICPPLDVPNMPYSQRQLVIVQPDQIVNAARVASSNAQSQSGNIDWMDVTGRIAKTILGINPITNVVMSLGIEALKAWTKARESGLDVLLIGHSEALALQFPPGHPRELTMYVAHPAVPTVYYTAAVFHRMAFEHKFSESIQLLMSLGASQIVVEHVHGWAKEFSANISAGLPKGEANFSAGNKASASSKLLFEAVLKNKKAPTLPDGLVWYMHEPTWQAVAKGRLEYGMQQFSLNVVYEDDYGVNAGLKVRAQKAGLELGGSFEDHMATIWKIHGEFNGNDD